MHEADDAYSIRSTWSCYWLDQFLTLALNILILSIFYISMDLFTNYFAHFIGCWASFVCSCHSILECCVMFSGVKLSIRSFVLLSLLLLCWLHWTIASPFLLRITKSFCFGNDPQRHANKGTQKIAEHRLLWYESSPGLFRTRLNCNKSRSFVSIGFHDSKSNQVTSEARLIWSLIWKWDCLPTVTWNMKAIEFS